ncbi:MAG: hypothetical protein ACR2PI_04385 [Hyphomicrobiaceae bacterium]
MTSLMTTLLNSTPLILEAPGFAAVAMCALGVGLATKTHREDKPVQLNRHTLTDIGIEPGSITWLRS